MYIEYTSQGFNIIGLSLELLSEIIRAFRAASRQDEPSELQQFVRIAEQELTAI